MKNTIKKKVDEMTRITRNMAKFMKIYKNRGQNELYDNYADRQMKQVVDDFRAQRRKAKSANN